MSGGGDDGAITAALSPGFSGGGHDGAAAGISITHMRFPFVEMRIRRALNSQSLESEYRERAAKPGAAIK